MEFQPGSVTLDDITGGTLGAGVVPWARFTEQEYAEVNGGAIVVGAAFTQLCQVALNNLVGGDRILMIGKARMTKGAVAGVIDYRFQMPAGTATVRWFGTQTSFGFSTSLVPIGAVDGQHACCIAEVSNPGTATIRFEARSIGSDSNCAIGDAEFYAVVFRGA